MAVEWKTIAILSAFDWVKIVFNAFNSLSLTSFNDSPLKFLPKLILLVNF